MFWDALYGRLQTECGYTPAQVSAMTLSDVLRLNRYWQHNPPPGMLLLAIAHTLGIKFPEPTSDASKHLTTDEALRMFQVTGGRITPDMVGD